MTILCIFLKRVRTIVRSIVSDQPATEGMNMDPARVYKKGRVSDYRTCQELVHCVPLPSRPSGKCHILCRSSATKHLGAYCSGGLQQQLYLHQHRWNSLSAADSGFATEDAFEVPPAVIVNIARGVSLDTARCVLLFTHILILPTS